MRVIRYIGLIPGFKLIYALCFLIASRPSQISAEPTRVDFNGSLNDASGQFDGISDSNLSYVTENNRTAVSFSGLEYVRFPMALSNSLGSQRLRFRIRFKISPDSQGNFVWERAPA